MSIDVSRLNIEVTDGAAWRRTMSVTIPADIVTSERKKIAKTLSKRVSIPGFRAGKVPASVIEKRFGQALDREMVDSVVGDAYKEALAAKEIQPISEGEVGKIDFQPEQDLTFEISFDVEPTFDISRLSGYSVERPAASVTDEDLDQVLDRLRGQQGTWEPTEEGRPEAGDLVSLTATQLEDGEPEGEPKEYDLNLGQGDAIEDVEAAVYTLNVGDEGDFEVTFPEDFANEERRGLTQNIRLKLRARKIRQLPELDDEFAKSVGDFETLEALKSRIREDLEKEAEQQSEQAVRSQLLDAILQANPFEVPVSMVNRYIDSVLGNSGVDANDERMAGIREQFGPEAERAVRRILVIEHVAETKELKASEDDIDERIEEIAKANDTSAAEVYARFQKSGRLEQMERDITEKKVFEFLKAESEITDAK